MFLCLSTLQTQQSIFTLFLSKFLGKLIRDLTGILAFSREMNGLRIERWHETWFKGTANYFTCISLWTYVFNIICLISVSQECLHAEEDFVTITCLDMVTIFYGSKIPIGVPIYYGRLLWSSTKIGNRSKFR